MAIVRHLADAVVIAMAFNLFVVLLGLFGFGIFLKTVFSIPGMIVSFLLVIVEVIWNRL